MTALAAERNSVVPDRLVGALADHARHARVFVDLSSAPQHHLSVVAEAGAQPLTVAFVPDAAAAHSLARAARGHDLAARLRIVDLSETSAGRIVPGSLDTQLRGLDVDVLVVDGSDRGASLLRGMAATLSRCHPAVMVRSVTADAILAVQEIVETLGYWSRRELAEDGAGRSLLYAT